MAKKSVIWTNIQDDKPMRKPYLIRTPDLDITSGGIRVMYGLYGHLLAKGQLAYLNTLIDVPSVGIYPEIYYGNDMMAGKVIRYILQKPGMMATPDENGVMRPGPVAFDPSEEIYVFSRVYDEWNVADDHVLFLPIIDRHTFFDKKGKRDKVAFYVGKGANFGKHPENAVELKREFAKDQERLAEFLNECETLYVYDRMSAIMEVARLCGCKVVYWGDMPKEQLEKYEPGMNGLGYQEEVHLDANAFVSHYVELGRIFSEKLDTFIDHTQA